MKQYEGVFILNPTLGEDAIKQNLSKIEEILKKQGGNISNSITWGKRRLPYPVKHHAEGYFVIFDFVLPPEKVAVAQAAFRLNEELLRVTITVKESKPSTNI